MSAGHPRGAFQVPMSGRFKAYDVRGIYARGRPAALRDAHDGAARWS